MMENQYRAPTVLVFPCSLVKSLDYANASRNRGSKVIGASSVRFSSEEEIFDHFVSLPFFDDPSFLSELADVIEKYDVTLIYSPHMVVWQKMEQILNSHFPQVYLDQTRPWISEFDDYTKALALSTDLCESNLEVEGVTKRHTMKPEILAAMFVQQELIPGWCSPEKVWMIADVMQSAPKGDVVEIGSYCGKSAFALGRMANYYQTGSLFCIDPWSSEEMIQENEAVNAATQLIDFEQVFSIFKMTLAGLKSGTAGWFRQRSDEVLRSFAKDLRAESLSCEPLVCEGKISVLHIDGNHDLDQVERDIYGWSKHILPGGWLIIDDYTHAFGDGPKVVADKFLLENKHRIESAIYAGTALFIKMN